MTLRLQLRLDPPVKLFLFCAGLMGVLAGCNNTYVKVDAMARAEAEKSIAYQIGTTNPELDVDSLRYKEAERFVKTALSGKGLYEAPNAQMADMIVNLDYGISPPKVTREIRSEAIYREVAGPTYTETVQSGTDAKGNPIYSTVTVRGPPEYRYVGEREYTVLVVTYEKYLRLTARETKAPGEGRPPAEIWTVDVSTDGENRDLRKALPALAAATIEYIGKDTRGEKTIKLKDKDKDGPIAFVKKGL